MNPFALATLHFRKIAKIKLNPLYICEFFTTRKSFRYHISLKRHHSKRVKSIIGLQWSKRVYIWRTRHKCTIFSKSRNKIYFEKRQRRACVRSSEVIDTTSAAVGDPSKATCASRTILSRLFWKSSHMRVREA